ncbi:MAG TPA: DUF6499 domain-containing protein [Rhodopila sp.]|nr:DUF6499 domain-containing protein [Rhodopila sp.]
MQTKYWRAPETIEQLNRLERPGFAVEFLRRNADYRRGYAHLLRQISEGALDPDVARAEFAHQWGLRFRP